MKKTYRKIEDKLKLRVIAQPYRSVILLLVGAFLFVQGYKCISQNDCHFFYMAEKIGLNYISRQTGFDLSAVESRCQYKKEEKNDI